MATNDTILIDGILDNIISSYNMENTPENRGKAFEDFAMSVRWRRGSCSATFLVPVKIKVRTFRNPSVWIKTVRFGSVRSGNLPL